jgi:uncharacterized membrane protein
MSLLVSYAASLVVFLSIDILWIKTVMQPLFERNLGELLLETPRMGPAGAFYALYVAGIIYLAVLPAAAADSLRTAAVNGAVVGFLAYGTYEITNLATLKGWSYEMVAIDVSWGVFLTTLTAVAGYMAYRWAAA